MDSAQSSDDQPGSAEEMLALMQAQRRSTRVHLDRRFSVLLIVWALAWAVGFSTLWSAERIGGNPAFRIPEQVAWPIFGVLILAGIVWSIVTGIASGRDFRGRSKLSGALYGWSWTISMVGAGCFAGGLERTGLSDEVSSLLYPGLFVTVVGILYLTGAALERSPAMFALGIVMIATAGIATFVGAPTHYLLYATVGPASMLVVAALQMRGVLPASTEDPA